MTDFGLPKAYFLHRLWSVVFYLIIEFERWKMRVLCSEVFTSLHRALFFVVILNERYLFVFLMIYGIFLYANNTKNRNNFMRWIFWKKRSIVKSQWWSRRIGFFLLIWTRLVFCLGESWWRWSMMLHQFQWRDIVEEEQLRLL